MLAKRIHVGAATVMTVFVALFVASPAHARPQVEVAKPTPPELVEFVAGQQAISRGAAENRLDRLAAASKIADALRADRPPWFAGAWVDPKSLKQIIGVVGDAGKFNAGLYLAGRPEAGDVDLAVRQVPFATTERVRGLLLQRARELKRRAPRLLAWVDEDAGALRVVLAPTSSSAIADRLASAADGSGLQVLIERVPPPEVKPTGCKYPNCDRPLRSGTGIGASGGSNCTGGFFAKSSKYRYFVTAGHCRLKTSKGTTWYAKAPTYYNHDTGNRSWSIGKNITSLTSYGPYDYMAVRFNKESFWWSNDPGGYYDDRRTGDNLGAYWSTRLPQVGEPSCRYGISSNYACGLVLSTNLTTYVGSVPVSGLFSTSSCSTAGDSGGPYLASGGVLLGVLSGGAGSCSNEPGAPSSGYTVAMQATTVLGLTGLKLVAGD